MAALVAVADKRFAFSRFSSCYSSTHFVHASILDVAVESLADQGLQILAALQPLRALN